MSKKKHPEHVNHERWLVSYADFITLLFAFFVVLFASGQSDKRKTAALANSMQLAFSQQGIFDPHARTPPISEQQNAIANAAPSPLALPVPTLAQTDDKGEHLKQAQIAESKIGDKVKEVVKAEVKSAQMADNIISVHSSAEGLVVSLREAGFFASGSAELREGSEPIFRAIASALPDQPMRIEGHTDDRPIHTAQFATNWELSTARAATITRLLISLRTVAPQKIAAAGYAEFRPIADNSTDVGRSANRRVDIVLLRQQTDAPTINASEYPAAVKAEAAKAEAGRSDDRRPAAAAGIAPAAPAAPAAKKATPSLPGSSR